ncbi:hypothetical protein M9H77_36402 [Catharanthus roseus]|uniref:Uncharacterized protein n=1 Tax=Catharanthus roseus TaxID=4058 RepID=A0ACB9ZTW4_CATRO|nr:hypothetical protein M9H77_36402 [Catharanthus roseus]
MLLDGVVIKEVRSKLYKMVNERVKTTTRKFCFGYFELPMLVIVTLPLLVGAEEPKDQGNRDLSRTVRLALTLVVEGACKGVQALIQDFDLQLGCLELKREEQSWATNWGLIGALD